jgi:hypothetical protein
MKALKGSMERHVRWYRVWLPAEYKIEGTAAMAASARRPLFRALRWGPRLALKKKSHNQTKTKQTKPMAWDSRR